MYLLLLHQLRIRTIVDYIFAEHRGSQGAVDFLGIDIFEFSVEDEVIAFGAQANRGFFPQEDEGEDIAILPHDQSPFVADPNPCRDREGGHIRGEHSNIPSSDI